MKGLISPAAVYVAAGGWLVSPDVYSWLKRCASSNNMSPFPSEYNHCSMRGFYKLVHCFNLKQLFSTIPAPELHMALAEGFVGIVSQPSLFLGSVLLPPHSHSCWFQQHFPVKFWYANFCLQFCFLMKPRVITVICWDIFFFIFFHQDNLDRE